MLKGKKSNTQFDTVSVRLRFRFLFRNGKKLRFLLFRFRNTVKKLFVECRLSKLMFFQEDEVTERKDGSGKKRRKCEL